MGSRKGGGCHEATDHSCGNGCTLSVDSINVLTKDSAVTGAQSIYVIRIAVRSGVQTAVTVRSGVQTAVTVWSGVQTVDTVRNGVHTADALRNGVQTADTVIQEH